MRCSRERRCASSLAASHSVLVPTALVRTTGTLERVNVLLRNPRREVRVDGPITVTSLLRRLEINPESVLVIRGDELVARDANLGDEDCIEIRPVISGGVR